MTCCEVVFQCFAFFEAQFSKCDKLILHKYILNVFSLLLSHSKFANLVQWFVQVIKIKSDSHTVKLSKRLHQSQLCIWVTGCVNSGQVIMAQVEHKMCNNYIHSAQIIYRFVNGHVNVNHNKVC